MTEYSVKVKTKNSNLKDRTIRICQKENIPYIIILSKCKVSNEINMSNVPKAFIGFSSVNQELSFKIISKKTNYEFIFNDMQSYETCKSNVDNELRKYHRDRISGSSSSHCSSPLSTTSGKEEEQFQFHVIKDMDSPPSSLLDYDIFFQKDYEIPEFKIGVNTMKGGYDNLEAHPFLKRNSKINPNIFAVMKMREEIFNENGVAVMISQDIIDGFTVKEIDKKLWISDIKSWDDIGGKLHIGDRVMLVNNDPVNNLSSYQQVTKMCQDYILTVQRLPKAKVFVFDKNKMDIKSIKLDKNNFIYNESSRTKSSWIITEFNRQNTSYISDFNRVLNIQAIIESNVQFLSLIIHSTKFYKALGLSRKPSFQQT